MTIIITSDAEIQALYDDEPDRIIVEEPELTVIVERAPVTILETKAADELVIRSVGERGPTGPQGPPGDSGAQNVFVQDTAPTPDPGVTKYLWIQTNMGVSGEDVTFWIEDGDA